LLSATPAFHLEANAGFIEFDRAGNHGNSCRACRPPKLRVEAGKKNINVRGDSKSAYEQVAGMYGIKVAFDPDLTARNVKLRIDGVDFDMAMQLLGASSQSFYRVVNPTLIFVAADTIAKRKEYSEEIEQTFRLDESVGPEEITEMTRVLREITNSTRITTNTASHSLTLRETADKVALAGQLIKELEQSRRDVMLDIDLLEVDRNAARRCHLPTSAVA
jgi:general secretion pathway protein D